MAKEPFNDLTPVMQARLDKWKANALPVKSADILRGKSLSSCRQVRGDYGDDIRDFERKDQEAWAKELQNNPIYRGYR